MPQVFLSDNNTLRQQVLENTKNIEEILRNLNITIDDYLSLTSTNAVENKVITLALDEKQDMMTSITNMQIDQLFN